MNMQAAMYAASVAVGALIANRVAARRWNTEVQRVWEDFGEVEAERDALIRLLTRVAERSRS